jgi:hypothetical protein
MTKNEAIVVLDLTNDSAVDEAAWDLRDAGAYRPILSGLVRNGSVREVPAGNAAVDMVPSAEAIAAARKVMS